MNNLFPSQLPNQLLLVMGEHAASSWMLEMAAWLSIQGEARVMDGGNRFNAYPVARSIRRQNYDPQVALARRGESPTAPVTDAVSMTEQFSRSVLVLHPSGAGLHLG